MEGDVVVWKLDRLSRFLRDTLLILDKSKTPGQDSCSITEAIDTTNPAGRMMMQMLGFFAEAGYASRTNKVDQRCAGAWPGGRTATLTYPATARGGSGGTVKLSAD
ncbi:recombinase family protein [Rhizobium leguminosarum]|uniref:recombinase family protein n=1 Tax=Rhizobium leguminosarum TaxID=384 RepID=UPI003D02B7C2